MDGTSGTTLSERKASPGIRLGGLLSPLSAAEVFPFYPD
jgi:hypothetical protein